MDNSGKGRGVRCAALCVLLCGLGGAPAFAGESPHSGVAGSMWEGASERLVDVAGSGWMEVAQAVASEEGAVGAALVNLPDSMGGIVVSRIVPPAGSSWMAGPVDVLMAQDSKGTERSVFRSADGSLSCSQAGPGETGEVGLDVPCSVSEVLGASFPADRIPAMLSVLPEDAKAVLERLSAAAEADGSVR